MNPKTRVPSHPATVGRPEEPSETAGGFSRLARPLPLILGLTLAVGAALTLAATAIAYQSPDPSATLTPLAYGALGLTALLGGVVAGRVLRERAVLGGLVSGVAFALLLTVLSWLLPRAADGAAAAWLSRAGVVVLHLLGACVARPRATTPGHAAGHQGTSDHRVGAHHAPRK